MAVRLGRICRHANNYGTADPYRSFLRDYALAKGLTTAQTEMGNPTFDDLFNDLTLAGVSYWEVAYSGNATLVPNSGLTGFTPSGTYFRLRQVMHYVRPGAVRIGALSSDPTVRVLAFSTNGLVTVVIDNTASAQTVNLSGLPPGNYGLSRSPSGATLFQELGIQTVGAGGTLPLTNVTGNSTVTTLYPYSGPNHPPTIMAFGANPGYLVSPTNTATLSVIANDAELDPLTYHWSVISQPAGAGASFSKPTNAITSVSGLTVSGTYIFNIDVNDGTNTSSQRVYLVVYDSNPPPVLGPTGFRINAPYGLVFGDPSGTTHANIELPTSSATLQVGISDLANSDFTGRGQWTLVSQPPGASATVGSTTYIFVSIRANVAGMTVPGDYVFQVNVTNPGHPDLTAQIVCTVRTATSAPIISSITPSPATLVLPMSTLQLSAVTSGSTNQPLRHWWVVKAAPAGAKLQFDHQGTTNTTVSNLTLPGSYTFTLRAFDDLHMTTQDKTVNVSAAPGAPVITSAAANSVIAGAPYTYTITANNNPGGFNAIGLPAGLGFTNGVISGTSATAGTYNIQLSATNASGTGYGNLALTVKLPLPVLTSALNADGLTNTAFAYTILASNVATSFGATGLPNGLSVNIATGAITGTPTNSGVYAVTIGATNTTGSAVAPLTIVIYNGAAPAPAVTSALTATGAVGMTFNYQIAAINNPTSFFAIGLPAGISFDPTSGRIFGTPSFAGTFPVTLRASNRGGIGSASMVLNINPEPSPKIAILPNLPRVDISFLAPVNHHYTVEWIENLLENNWAALTSGTPGDGTTNTVMDTATNTSTRFYRLNVTTP